MRRDVLVNKRGMAAAHAEVRTLMIFGFVTINRGYILAEVPTA
jgi:hypothetical protein